MKASHAHSRHARFAPQLRYGLIRSQHRCAGANARSGLLSPTQAQAQPPGRCFPAQVVAQDRYRFCMKPDETSPAPCADPEALRPNNFAELLLANILSSLASDFPIHPGKLFPAACDQTANVRLFYRQGVG